MGLRSALVDRAFQQRKASDPRRVAGRIVYKEVEGPEIRARLTVQAAGERDERGRKITEPRNTLMLYKRDRDGDTLEPSASDRYRVLSKQLGEAVWEVDGEPQPIRKKRLILGWQLTVRRLKENTRRDS